MPTGLWRISKVSASIPAIAHLSLKAARRTDARLATYLARSSSLKTWMTPLSSS